MIGGKSAESVPWVRPLCLLLAGLLWLSVAVERPGEIKLQVPVVLEHLPPGLVLTSAPSSLVVTVAGPRILLWGLPLSPGSCALDLTGAGAGEASFGTRDLTLRFDRELKVVRVFPATLRLTLGKTVPG